MKQVAEEAEVEMQSEMWTTKDIVLLSCRLEPGMIISGHVRAAKSARHGPAGHKLVAASTRPLHSPVGHMLVAASIRPLSHVVIDQCVCITANQFAHRRFGYVYSFAVDSSMCSFIIRTLHTKVLRASRSLMSTRAGWLRRRLPMRMRRKRHCGMHCRPRRRLLRRRCLRWRSPRRRSRPAPARRGQSACLVIYEQVCSPTRCRLSLIGRSLSLLCRLCRGIAKAVCPLY